MLAAALVLVVATQPLVTPGATPGAGRPARHAVPGWLGRRRACASATWPRSWRSSVPTATPLPLVDLDGNPVRLADLRGRPVWINFWASWCPPCQAETPTIRDIAAAYAPQGLEVIGISVQEATEDDVRAYAEKYGLGYTIAADLAGDVFRRYRVFGLPTHYFLDENGVIRSIVNGPVTPASATSNLALLGLVPQAAAPAASLELAP